MKISSHNFVALVNNNKHHSILCYKLAFSVLSLRNNKKFTQQFKRSEIDVVPW